MRSSDDLTQHARARVKRCGGLERGRRRGWTHLRIEEEARARCATHVAATAFMPANSGADTAGYE